MILYYEFNREGKRPLRIPMTEAAFLKAKEEPDRWFISFGDCVLEVTKSEYVKYYKEKEHTRHLRRTAAKYELECVPLDSLEEQFTYDRNVFSVHAELSVEDEVIQRDLKTALHKLLCDALEKLDEQDLKLVVEIHFKHKSQNHLSEELGISQQGVSKRYRAVLRKLRKLMGDIE